MDRLDGKEGPTPQRARRWVVQTSADGEGGGADWYTRSHDTRGRSMEMDRAPNSRPAAGRLTIRDAQASEHDQVGELVMSAYEEYRAFVSPEFVAEFQRDTREVFAEAHTQLISPRAKDASSAPSRSIRTAPSTGTASLLDRKSTRLNSSHT